MRITAAARALGISISTLKRLEHQGVIQVQRDWNGDRRYSAEDVQRIRAIYYPKVSAVAPTTPDTADRQA